MRTSTSISEPSCITATDRSKLINVFRRAISRFSSAVGWLALTSLVSAQALLGATLATDKADYAPGQYVTFTGTGWQPGETVNIDIYETSVDPFLSEGSVSAVADADGNISNGELLVQQSFLGQGFLANAVGASSGATASVTFSDSLNNDFKQAANKDGSPWGLGNIHWIGSALQGNNSRYFEGMSTAQRIILSGIPATAGDLHTLHISHQANQRPNTPPDDFLT